MITVFTIRDSANRRIVLQRNRCSASISFPDFDGITIDVDRTPKEAEVLLDYWRSHNHEIEIEHFDDSNFDDYDPSFDDTRFLDDLPEDWATHTP